MTEYRVPGLEGEDDQITFDADDLAAKAISFARLIKLGRERTGGVEWVCVDGEAEGLDELPEPETNEAVHHRWAWAFARECLTNYDAVARELLLQPDGFRLCEGCRLRERELLQSRGSSGEGRDLICDDCGRRLLTSMNARVRRVELLGKAVAVWARARWPELEIRGSCRVVMGHEELENKAREMAVTARRARDGLLN